VKALISVERKRLGEILEERGLVSSQDLARALTVQNETGERTGKILIDLGFVSERDVLSSLAIQLDVPLFDGEFPAVPVEADRLGYRFLRSSLVLPLHREESVLSVGMADPADSQSRSAIRLRTGLELRVFLMPEAEIVGQLGRLYGEDESDASRIETLGEGLGDDDVEQLRDLASEAPVIRMVNLIITRAVESRASDIHVEPFERHLHLRYRVDGVLHNVDPPPSALRAAIISRIKLMAKLNIAERRLPQDGRIKVRALGKEIDLRVSTLPTMYGESVVMRILDKSNSDLIDLRRLGFPEDLYGSIVAMTSKPHGIFLVTGPTGSGKSTTLYSALKRINIPDRKIITIEDPVEYQMDGINQIQVNPQIGLTFASGLRHIVRQDPDVIMIGEIRDLETAEIAIRAALTGHLVFSTLHTNDAPSAVTRLVDMGVEDYLLASSLIGILAQRLVRVICSSCRTTEHVPIAALGGLGQVAEAHPGTGSTDVVEIHRGAGCESCGFTGYAGRLGIFELLDVDDGMRAAITTSADSNALGAQALRSGMRPLNQDGWSKVLAGITTPGEILRVSEEI
jgi:general secretion pathway protein E